MLDENGWMQRANLALSAVMVLGAVRELRRVHDDRGPAMVALSGGGPRLEWMEHVSRWLTSRER